MHKYTTFDTFQEAFLQTSQHIIDNPEFQTTSRIGEVHEISGLSYDVLDLKSYQFENKEIIRPKYWGGYIVKPISIEFWQGRPNRMHDRIRYTLQENFDWKIERLAP